MAADLHIHASPTVTEAHMRAFFGHTIGSKYFEMKKAFQLNGEEVRLDREIQLTPSIWVGEVSWLKAGLLEDSDSYVPLTVQKVHEIVGEDLRVINDAMISEIKGAFLLENNTKKPGGVNDGGGYRLAEIDSVVKFLEKHKGEKAFTISW